MKESFHLSQSGKTARVVEAMICGKYNDTGFDGVMKPDDLTLQHRIDAFSLLNLCE